MSINVDDIRFRSFQAHKIGLPILSWLDAISPFSMDENKVDEISKEVIAIFDQNTDLNIKEQTAILMKAYEYICRELSNAEVIE